jgi:hypothetical protein
VGTDPKACRNLSRDGFKKLAWPYFECASQCNNIQECDVSFPSLNTTHVVSMEISEFSQLLLGETPFKPERPHSPAKQTPWIRNWHLAIIGSLTTMSLHTISVT